MSQGSAYPMDAFRLPPPLVTTLPTSPVDGQEVYYQNAMMLSEGIMWHFRYQAAAPSAHKWQFLGGAKIARYHGGQILQFTGTSYGDPVAGVSPSIIVPLAGDYYIEWSGWGHNNAGGANVTYVNPRQAGGYDPNSTAFDIHAAEVSAFVTYTRVTRAREFSGLVAGVALTLRGRTTAGTGVFSYPDLTITPQRVS